MPKTTKTQHKKTREARARNQAKQVTRTPTAITRRNIALHTEQSIRRMSLENTQSRAFPDILGFKPVQLRILYAMWRMHLLHNRPPKKSARTVGETLGKYHPHGDSSVYQALVRMAQSWSVRYPLIDGQGNFGSVAGDVAAAMRYTEARLTALAEFLLQDVELAPYRLTFDDSDDEPFIFFPQIPSLLLFGISGIGHSVQSTNIPSHNIKEVLQAASFVAEHVGEDIAVEDIVPKFIKGPDLPIGGIIYRYDDNCEDTIIRAYKQDKGTPDNPISTAMVHQPIIEVSPLYGGQTRVVIKSPLHGKSMESLINSLSKMKDSADKKRQKAFSHVSNAQDTSAGQEVQYVITLKKGADIDNFLEVLFTLTKGTVQTDIIALYAPDLYNAEKIMESVNDELGVLKNPAYVPVRFSLVEYLNVFTRLRLSAIGLKAARDLSIALKKEEIAEIAAGVDKTIYRKVVAIAEKHTDKQAAIEEVQQAIKINRKPLTLNQAKWLINMSVWDLSKTSLHKAKKQLTEARKAIKAQRRLLDKHDARIAQILTTYKDAIERFGDERKTQIVNTKPSKLPIIIVPDGQDVATQAPRFKSVKNKRVCK